jgi:hypothetical protein
MSATRIVLMAAFLVSLFGRPGQAQQARFGNEWINYDQTYFKIPVVDKGIYRIPYDQLQKAGFPVQTNPTKIQLFKQGTEQAIYISGEQDGKLDTGDFIEFYGVRNDGGRDSSLYRDPKLQTNKYVSLFSDTTYYFLTFRVDNGSGKRMATAPAPSTAGLQAETYHFEENLLLPTSWYPVGPTYPIGVRYLSGMTLSSYEVGKGYMDASMKKGNGKDYVFSVKNAEQTGGKPKLELTVYGETPDAHIVEIRGGPAAAQTRLLTTLNFNNYGLPLIRQDLEWSDFSASQLVANIKSAATVTTNESIVPVWLKLTYPQKTTLDGVTAGKTFRLRANAGGTSLLQLAAATAADQIYDVTQPGNIQRVSGTLAGGVLTAGIANTQSSRELWVNRAAKTVSAITPVGFRKIDPTKHNYLIITDKRLQKPAGGFTDIVKGYAAYRASQAGGKHDTLVVDINLLSNQFNYGERSGVAIRHFADYMVQNGNPKNMLLVGRTIHPQYYRSISNFYSMNYVPNGGWPGSDNVLVDGLKGEADVPAIPVGRLSVSTPDEILAYLNKVKEYESAEPALWRKNFLNLSGGKTASELSTFKTYVEAYKNTATKGLGANVSILSKKTDDPVEFINITSKVNDGIGMLTFFGHSGPSITDIDVGYVSNDLLGYKNKGKYPIVLINGCDAGNIFNNDPKLTFSSDWINTADRGAILMLATTFSGFPTYLNGFSTAFYDELFTRPTSYGQTVGTSLINTIRNFIKQYPGEMALGHSQQFLLQGDPAVVPFPYTKPDYAVSPSSIFLRSFNGQEVVASVDSFRVGVVVSNLGRTLTGKVKVGVKRTLSNGIILDLGTRSFQNVAFQDTLYFSVSNSGTGGGNNRFEVVVDPDNEIDELSKANNKATLDYVIPGSLARPVLPQDFAIVGTQENNTPTVRLLAEYTPLSTVTGTPNILYELDTAATFTSAFKKTTTLPSSNSEGWKVSLLTTDSTVYYWRVRDADKAVSSDNQWTSHSFTYIKGVEDGWSQSTGAQFASAIKNQVTLTGSRWDFQTNKLTINLKVVGAGAQAAAFKQTQLSLNNLLMVTNGNCNENTLIAVSFAKTDLTPYSIVPSQLCGNSPFASNYFTDKNIADGLLDKYLDGIATGDFVLLFPSGKVDFTTWPATLKQKIAALGADASKLDQLKAGHPFILLTRKGETTPLVWRAPVSQAAGDTTTLSLSNYSLGDSYTSGAITTTLIGPTTRWGQLRQQVNRGPQQTSSLEVYGTDFQGNETLLISNLTSAVTDMSSINATKYPYLRLKEKLATTAYGTTPQLKRWLVTYKSVPEGVTRLEGQTSYRSSVVSEWQEGQKFEQSLNFVLLSSANFPDSLVIREVFTNSKAGIQTVKTTKAAPAASIPYKLSYSNIKPGENRITVTVNPQAQPELSYANNTVSFVLNVAPDNVPPVLEVTFDGRVLRNGEFTSSSPKIAIRLKDENLNDIRKDTSGVDIYLARPNQDLVRVNFRNNPDLTWQVLPENDFRAVYTPKNLPEGLYQLQVQGKDLAGNIAGGFPYSVDFKVSAQTGLLQFMVNPNPMEISTKFSLIVTGDRAPAGMNIEIYSLQGQLLRILSSENQPLVVGRNEYYWDGTDQRGGRLPAGTYLYKVKFTDDFPITAPIFNPAGRVIILR